MSDVKTFFHELVYYQVELWDAVDARLQEECGLPLPWFEILDLLARVQGARVQDIAAAFSISVGGTSKVVDKLEAGGYCGRRPNPADRRSSLIELTAQGRERLERALATHEITWRWVKGHAGHPENERADELARAGMAPFKRKR